MQAEAWTGHTQGMTIRDILEKVDLFNVNVQNSQKGTEKHLSKGQDGKTIIETNDPSSAYLGPKLWDRQITLDLGLDLDSSADEGSISGLSCGPRSYGCLSPADGAAGASGIDIGGLSPGGAGLGSSGMSPVFSKISIEVEPKERQRSVSSDLQVMNMEEFLAENGLSLDMDPNLPLEICAQTNIQTNTEIRDVKPSLQMTRPNVIMNVPKVENREVSVVTSKRGLEADDDVDDPSQVTVVKRASNDFLYAESKRARLEREKAEKKRKFELELEFDPQDLALATVPGAQFDPSTRTFDVDELRPQPIIRKRKRIYVPDDNKDDRYWNNRVKNNVAARRSREARRLKENQIALRAAYLEKENRVIKMELEDVKFDNTKLATERDILKMKLAKYEKM